MIAAPPLQGAAPEHCAPVIALLEAARLPTRDLSPRSMRHFIVAFEGDVLVGAVGLEPCGETGLVRSLVVAPAARRHGLGGRLVAAIEAHARELGLRRLALLTETAQALFARLGYEAASRDAAPPQVRASEEFSALCPVTAAYMEKSIDV